MIGFTCTSVTGLGVVSGTVGFVVICLNGSILVIPRALKNPTLSFDFIRHVTVVPRETVGVVVVGGLGVVDTIIVGGLCASGS